jgi:hypothetical protein
LNFEKPYIAEFIWSTGKRLKRPSQYCLIHYIKQYLHVWSESSNTGLVVLAYIADFLWSTGKISKTTKPILLDSLYKAVFTCME